MEKPVGYLVKGELRKEKKDFSNFMGQPEPEAVYSQTQIQELFDKLNKQIEIPFRHTKIVDWDVIKEKFSEFGIQ